LYQLLKEQEDPKFTKETKRPRRAQPGKRPKQGGSKQQVIWTNQHRKVLAELIDILTTSKVMAFPDFEKSFVLHTDASQDGLGAILYQKQDDGRLAVIAYGSRTLSPAEKNYHLHSGKLEFLALKWAITERFRDILYYTPSFDVYTDNNPLTYVLTSAKLDATRHRWVAELADFQFKIHYKPGRLNTDADTLSRMPLQINDFAKDCTEVSGREELVAVIEALLTEETDGGGLMHGAPNIADEEEQKGMLGAATFQTLSGKDIAAAQDNDSTLKRVK
jgi:hypothetical protein